MGDRNSTRYRLGAAAAAVGAAVICREAYCAVMYIYNVAVRRGDKTFLTKLIDVKDEAQVLYQDLNEEDEELIKWVEQCKVESWSMNSFDNIKLYANAYKQSKDSDLWVIIAHGYGGFNEMMNYAGERFYRKGYNCLIIDLRGHGRSEGDYIGLGWHDRLDIIKWCNKILEENKNAEICLYGVSMGGSAVLMAGGEKLPPAVKCIISDCAFTSAYDVIKELLKKVKIPGFPLLDFAGLICFMKNEYCFRQASAIKQLKKCHLPVLFLHGTADKFVPPQMIFKLAAAAKGKKEIMLINNAGHGVSAMIDKKTYWNRVFSFAEKYIQ